MIPPSPKEPAKAMELHSREMASAVDSTPEVGFSFCLPSRVAPERSSRKMVTTFSTVSVSGWRAFRSSPADSCSTRVWTMSISS